MSHQNDVIELKNVDMYYDSVEPVLENINLTLESGSFHYLTGESGAGKSSLIRLMYLGHRRYSGSMKILGYDVDQLEPRVLPGLRQQIGVVFQDFYLLNHISTLDNVALPLRVRGMSMRQSRTYASEMLTWVGLGDQLNAFPNELSGGEQQRISLARAVIGKPRLLLADEPTGSVDDKIAIKLMMLFEELNNKGTTVVFATHNRDLVSEFSHPEIVIEENNVKIKSATSLRRAKSA